MSKNSTKTEENKTEQETSKKVDVSILKELLRLEMINFEDIPKDDLIEEICLFELQHWRPCYREGSSVEKKMAAIPENLRTQSVCLAFIRAFQLGAYLPEYLYNDPSSQSLATRNICGLLFNWIPKPLQEDSSFQLATVKENGFLIRLWYKQDQIDLCLAAVQQNGLALGYLSLESMTKKVITCALRQNGLALQYVPIEFRTETICLFAVKKNGLALRFVPKKFWKKSLYLAAVQSGNVLDIVPKLSRTEEICLAAVKKNGLALKDVPEHFKKENMCLVAVKENAEAFEYVPEKYRTENIYLEAVQNAASEMLAEVPEELKTETICLNAIEKEPFNIQRIPEKLATDDFYLKAYQRNPMVFWDMPHHLLTEKMCLDARYPKNCIISDLNLFEHIPDRLKTLKVCLAAIEINMDQIEEVPQHLQTDVIYAFALQQFSIIGLTRSYQETWKEISSYWMKKAIKKEGLNLQYVKENLKTEELCKIAVQQNGLALQFVPQSQQTLSLCQMAVEQNPQALFYVPDNLKQELPSVYTDQEIKTLVM